MRPTLSREVVDRFKETNISRQGRNGRRAKISDAGNSHRRPGYIVDRRVEMAVSKLEARFVDCAAVDGCHVADLSSLIGIAQSRSAAYRIQSADGPRVNRTDVIDAVACAYLVSGIEPVICAREKV